MLRFLMPRMIGNSAIAVAVAFCASLRLQPAAPAGEVAAQTKPALTLQNFGGHNADCLEWTNSCAVCRRLAGQPARAGRPWSRRGGVKFACSTPGIACLPGELVCLQKRAAK
jgi:hypothetical protein